MTEPPVDATRLAALLRDAADAVAGLPRRVEEDLLASRGEIPVEVIHGSTEQWAAWARFAATVPPRAPIICYPSLDVLRAIIATDLGDATAPFPELSPRALLAASAVTTDEDRALVDLMIGAGFEVRLAPSVPSWLYADAGRLSALPLTWGEHPPSSIVVIRDPAISTALAQLLEPAWAAAVPVGAAAEWTETLRLAAAGLTDTAIAGALGVSMRTIQRRFADAMRHHGVTSRFALGVAWRASVDADEEVDPPADGGLDRDRVAGAAPDR